MNKRAHFYVNYNNMVVLKNYLDIIKKALSSRGFECDDVKCLDGLDKNDLYVFPMGIDAFKFYYKGFKNFILWQQGATADESYMRNKSKLRYYMLNYMDCFAMKKAKIIFFCSQYMQQHYEKIAHRSFKHKAYLMPCYNEELSVSFIENKDYTKKNFTYVGSIDLWQCFDKTAALYKSVEDQYPDAFFKVITFSAQEAERKIKALGIKNYTVKSVDKKDIQHELSDMVFGFIVRDDCMVNRVATPTKISSYMSVGIIPIFSTVLKDFARASSQMQYVIPINNFENWPVKKIDMKIDKEALKKEYTHLFHTYYGTEMHISNILKLMEGTLK